MSELSRRISDRRKSLKMSQEDLAELIGTNQRQISRYETGENDPSAEVLAAIARALETTPDWLLGFSHDSGKSDLTSEERQLLAIYRRKTPEKRRQALDVVRVL